MKWTIHKAAVEFGASRETLARGLKANDLDVKAGQEFTTKQIFKALAGDFKFERTRRERAEADAKERENRVATGELFDLAAIEKRLWTDFLAPLKHECEIMPDQYCALCNPADPATAKKVLVQWVETLKVKLKGA
jgi:hypothetical protein